MASQLQSCDTSMFKSRIMKDHEQNGIGYINLYNAYKVLSTMSPY